MKVLGCFSALVALAQGAKELGEKDWNQIEGKNTFAFFMAPW